MEIVPWYFLRNLQVCDLAMIDWYFFGVSRSSWLVL
jgi:hypothetical protein